MNLKVQKRDIVGKKVKRLRKQGIVPGVIYGKHLDENKLIQFNKIEFLKLYKEA
jgi:large subunit ribosomal protein L25